jgi:hypothetical protein
MVDVGDYYFGHNVRHFPAMKLIEAGKLTFNGNAWMKASGALPLLLLDRL